ncbi:MAG: hypothetical protein IK088_02195 [Lachnospiraceae bacterium]|nr:hypothetical protein [Lachnospiraceae bacterium]
MKTIYTDMAYLENKYHKTDEPFNPLDRMAYHGYEYDASTGLDDDAMRAELHDLAKTLEGQPHPIIKARLFAFLLDNARIDVSEHDWFVGFYNWGRLLWKQTVEPWSEELFGKIPEIRVQKDRFNNSGAAAIWPDFDHVIPNWDALLELGFSGILERAKRYRSKRAETGITPEQEAFFEGIEISYDAAIRLLDRYYRYALTKHNEKSKLQAECLKNLRDGKPTNLYEALQAMYVFFMVCECVDNYQTRSLGNGIDSTLLPFFENDVKTARFSKEEEKEFLAYFFMQFSAIGNYWGHPMYMGGTKADGSTKFNELSMMILDIYEELRIYNPKVQIKVAENTPKAVLYRVFDLIRNGVSSFVFCCEPGYMKAIMGYGASSEEAREFELSGCYETRVRSNESSTGVAYVNAAKAVELVFFNGLDRRTGQQVGLKTGDVAEFGTFDDFYSAFIKQWEYLIEESIRIGNAYEGWLAYINPSNVYSGTIEHALQKAMDGYSFGVKYNNSNILNCGFASAVDSLMAVKKLCFERKAATLFELSDALKHDWNGYEKLRMAALNLPNKYGNGDQETDRIASALAEYFSNKVNNRPNARGGVYKAIMHSARQFLRQGEKTGALPDGRKAGTELSKNASPVNGADRNGVTALIRSALNLTPHNYHESFCLDVMLHPSAAGGDEGLAALYGLLMTYLKNGGMALQFNIMDVKTLRDAQRNPEKYKNLQVRVCGWNVLWNNLTPAEQEAYILRCETIR